MAIAILHSVTVSIAAETMGILSSMFLENLVDISTCDGKTLECPGTSRTSSYVRYSSNTISSFVYSVEREEYRC